MVLLILENVVFWSGHPPKNEHLASSQSAMGNVPVLSPQEVIKILRRLEFEEVRQRGSHKQFRHPDGRGTTVPFHKGRDIAPTLLRKIARDIGLTVDHFLEHR